MTKEHCVIYAEHFVADVKPSKEISVVLLLDNHDFAFVDTGNILLQAERRDCPELPPTLQPQIPSAPESSEHMSEELGLKYIKKRSVPCVLREIHKSRRQK
jgi:hypothetical protein